DLQADRTVFERYGHVPDLLLVAAIESIGQPKQRRKIENRTLGFGIERLELRMSRLRHGLTVKTAHCRNDEPLFSRKAREIGVRDQIGRVFVMTRITDKVTDVVEVGRGFQQFSGRGRLDRKS